MKSGISSFWILVLAVILYTIGVFFIPKDNIDELRDRGYVQQDEYTYTDSEGEEHEGKSLFRVVGKGKVLTYKDVYFLSVPMFVWAMIFGSFVFGKGIKTRSEDSLRHIVLANCVLGALLFLLTTKDSIWATLFFWLGIVVAYLAICRVDNND